MALKKSRIVAILSAHILNNLLEKRSGNIRTDLLQNVKVQKSKQRKQAERTWKISQVVLFYIDKSNRKWNFFHIQGNISEIALNILESLIFAHFQ